LDISASPITALGNRERGTALKSNDRGLPKKFLDDMTSSTAMVKTHLETDRSATRILSSLPDIRPRASDPSVGRYSSPNAK
jgi:hypothetical protein